MSREPHIIDIDRIVLNDVQGLRPFEVRARIHAEVARALRGIEIPVSAGDASPEVADAVTNSVLRSLKTGLGDT